jgi:hypothetical protein
MATPASLPPLYAGWLDQLLDGPIPAETNATCHDCAMLLTESERSAPLAEAEYNPETKCCTYLPELWNFLVGGVLLDSNPDAERGRATVEARIDRGAAVTPLGLGKSRTFRLLYHTGGIHTFGQSRHMRCPHYLHDQGGLCGVWRNRESTCATWFCKHVRGSVGKSFWSHLHQALRTAERTLAGWALVQLGLDGSSLAQLYEPRRDEQLSTLTGWDVDERPDPRVTKLVWGNWLGRERELYRECARLVRSLTWTDVLGIGGAELDLYARLVRDAHARLLSDAVPESPTIALVQITPRGDRARLATYSGLDPLDVPAIVTEVLPYFDGRPTSEAIDAIREATGATVDPSLVRKLADFGILRDLTRTADPSLRSG